MGFQLKLVISSRVSAEERKGIMSAVRERWPFCRGPRDPSAYSNRAVFAPPELTSYLYDDFDEAERVDEMADDVESGLADWSRGFPIVAYALVEAECFGGNCLYRGFCCRNGELVLRHEEFDNDRLIELVRTVGIETSGTFAPFVRGFFAGPGSGGFE